MKRAGRIRTAGFAIGQSPVLAIDPGLDTGVSWSLSRTYLAHGAADVATCGAAALGEFARHFPQGFTRDAPPTAVIEVPRVYPEKREENPNDLITLAIRVGVYVQTLQSMRWRVLGVEPREWKGQLPKQAHHARLLRDHRGLAEAVAVNVEAESKRHNAYDAFGLLVWAYANRGLVLRDLTKDI